MDITVYLPNALGEAGKKAGINFSRALRDAVEKELELMEAIERMETTQVKLKVRDDEDRALFARFEGKLIASVGDLSAYRKDDGDLVLYNQESEDYEIFDASDEEQIEEHIISEIRDQRECMEMLHKLDITPTVDL